MNISWQVIHINKRKIFCVMANFSGDINVIDVDGSVKKRKFHRRNQSPRITGFWVFTRVASYLEISLVPTIDYRFYKFTGFTRLTSYSKDSTSDRFRWFTIYSQFSTVLNRVLFWGWGLSHILAEAGLRSNFCSVTDAVTHFGRLVMYRLTNTNNDDNAIEKWI